jgi:transcriptional regulator with XRE-family HTH domain
MGLRRDDVASLSNISEVWYARFETGRAKISLPALARVADTLNLSAAERCELLALVHPEWGAALGELAKLAYGSIE